MSFLTFLLPVFIVLTVCALLLGLYGMLKGGRYTGNKANKLMRWRVAFQFIAVILGMLILYFKGS